MSAFDKSHRLSLSANDNRLSILATHNPNKVKNRVPTEGELVSLRLIAMRKSQLLSNLDTRAFEAEATCGEIMIRLEQQQQVIESIQSELQMANQYADMLKTQRTMVDEDMNELRGVLHPIRRIPVEILRHIFEDTLQLSKQNEVWQATQLSHVCQYWREVALNDPSLWTEIAVNFRRSLGAITEYWDRAVTRVKKAPANITFSNVGGGSKTSIPKRFKKVAACKLKRIRVIRTLRIVADPEYPTTDAFSMITSFPSGTIDLLELDGENTEKVQGATAFDWATFLNKLPPSKTLALSSLHVNLTNLQPFPSLIDLQLGSCVELDLPMFLGVCPNIQRLTADSCFPWSGASNPPVTLAALTHISVQEVMSFPWTTPLILPCLSSLELGWSYRSPDERVIQFITNHHSISDLDLSGSGGTFSSLATAAPQITRLTLLSPEILIESLIDWESASLQGPAFCHLKMLKLWTDGMKLDIFDRLVQTRCLPTTHAECRLLSGCSPLEALVVTLPLRLRKSRFLADVTKRTDQRGGSVSLSWI